MTSQQLRFGAYWDAIPPFYSVQGLPPIQGSNYEEFTDTSNLMPVEMPKDLVFKFLWQVRSITIKLEYEFDAKTRAGGLVQLMELQPINSQYFKLEALLFYKTQQSVQRLLGN